jgi:hypothetical protein
MKTVRGDVSVAACGLPPPDGRSAHCCPERPSDPLSRSLLPSSPLLPLSITLPLFLFRSLSLSLIVSHNVFITHQSGQAPAVLGKAVTIAAGDLEILVFMLSRCVCVCVYVCVCIYMGVFADGVCPVACLCSQQLQANDLV